MNLDQSTAGIITDPKEAYANYWLNAVSIFVPFMGGMFGLRFLDSWIPSRTTFVLFVLFFLFTVIGLITGLHRYFSHRSFETSRLFRLLLAIGGSWAMQGPIDRWVADHRRHHRYSDQAFDVHSPYWKNDQKITSGFMRFAHAHFLWMFMGFPTCKEKYAKDMMNDSISRHCSELYWLLCASSLFLPSLLGYAFGGVDEAIKSFVWAGCFRVSLIQQFAWSVNSFGHMFGGKTPGSKDEARNNWVLTFLVFGEGLHSYHHVHQATAVNKPVALDTTGYFIRSLEKLGVVWNVKRY